MTESHSEARKRLAAMIAERDSVRADLAAASERARRLELLASATSPAASELAMLDSRESAAIVEWSRSADAKLPVADVKARERLKREAEAACISADQARRALDTVAAEGARLAERLARLGPAIELAAAEITASEVLPALADALEVAARAKAEAERRLGEARELLLRSAESRREHPGSATALRAIEGAAPAVDRALAAPAPVDASGFRHALSAHLDALGAGADAAFDLAAAVAPYDPEAGFERVKASYLSKIGAAA